MQNSLRYHDADSVQTKLEEIAGAKFNSCLLNMYRDGTDHMSWHSDNEKLYGDDPVIGMFALHLVPLYLQDTTQRGVAPVTLLLCAFSVVCTISTCLYWHGNTRTDCRVFVVWCNKAIFVTEQR